MTQRRLIEETFPLKKVSEDSKHEKNVRHGHISTLHIWPARRPLAACRAAIIAALMPDPGDEKSRHELNKKIESITHWGTENGPALDFFRQEIRKAFGGRAPRVLDMFAGGGAIPLEAMRLGCDVVANDYNPVAWFILKCTLEFPQRLAGETWPLPRSSGGAGERGSRGEEEQLSLLAEDVGRPGTLANHVRYWGEWVLGKARTELEPYYPMVNGQTTVAYLWARTVPCPDPACSTEVPLLKTLWLCKKADKRRALRLLPDAENHRVNFEIWTPGPKDEVPPGTMAGAKSRCPVCGVNLTPHYIKQCGASRQLRARLTAVVIDTDQGKEYRLPTTEEETALRAATILPEVSIQIPYGLPTEPQEKNPRTLIVQLYSLDTWDRLFTSRQLLSLASFVKWTRNVREEMDRLRYSEEWIEAVTSLLGLAVDRLADYGSSITHWQSKGEFIVNTFQRFALPISWDFSEVNPLSGLTGSYRSAINWISSVTSHLTRACGVAGRPQVLLGSATDLVMPEQFDVIITDPPYYNAIPYADIADFFYVWLRRTVGSHYPQAFATPLAPKSNELSLRLPHADIPDEHTPEWYEQGMAVAFSRACEALVSDGRLVIVFAHKDPAAWETLVRAMIHAGFTVTASWPIDTEMGNRTRAMKSAALASSIWMVCRKRHANAGVGRYATIRRAMQERITERLRYFWDIGISGPDFVWAAVGPALESYSAYDEVRRLDGSPFTVSEFLREARRLVADFALGQILQGRSTEGLDEWTRYYLMHRDYFGLERAPVGECILLSQGYGLDLNDLRGPRGFLTRASGSDLRLAKWNERRRDDLGEPHPSGGLPMIDILHRLMHLWAAGNLDDLNTYAAEKGLRQNELFWAVAQAVLEMAPAKSRERTLLEALVAWGRGKAPEPPAVQERLPET